MPHNLALRNQERERGAGPQSGFTLIELLVVLGILATLAVAVMVGLGGVSQQKFSVAQVQDIRDLKGAMIRYTLHTGCNIKTSNMAELWDKQVAAVNPTCAEKWKGPYVKIPSGWQFGTQNDAIGHRGPLGAYVYVLPTPDVGGSKWNAVVVKGVAGDVAAAIDRTIDGAEEKGTGMVVAGLTCSGGSGDWNKGAGGATVGGGAAASDAEDVCFLIEPIWE